MRWMDTCGDHSYLGHTCHLHVFYGIFHQPSFLSACTCVRSPYSSPPHPLASSLTPLLPPSPPCFLLQPLSCGRCLMVLLISACSTCTSHSLLLAGCNRDVVAMASQSQVWMSVWALLARLTVYIIFNDLKSRFSCDCAICWSRPLSKLVTTVGWCLILNFKCDTVVWSGIADFVYLSSLSKPTSGMTWTLLMWLHCNGWLTYKIMIIFYVPETVVCWLKLQLFNVLLWRSNAREFQEQIFFCLQV